MKSRQFDRGSAFQFLLEISPRSVAYLLSGSSSHIHTKELGPHKFRKWLFLTTGSVLPGKHPYLQIGKMHVWLSSQLHLLLYLQQDSRTTRIPNILLHPWGSVVVICHTSANAQDNNNNYYYLYMQWSPWFSWYIFREGLQWFCVRHLR